MTQEHTPGRWTPGRMTMTRKGWAALHSGKHPIDIVQRGSDVIAAVWGVDEEDEANAHLIAAAPDLLEALEWVAGEAKGMMVFEADLREIAGNTNVNQLKAAIDAARAALKNAGRG